MLAVAILAAVLAIVYLLVVVPLQELYADRQTTREGRAMLASRLAAAAAELPALRARLAELRTTASASNLTLEGASDAIAAANLQSRLEAFATSFGLTLGSTEALPAEDRAGFRRIGLRIAVSGEYENLVRLLGAVETATPPLVLDNLRIRTVLRPAAAAGSAKLDAAFEVYGVRAAGAPVGAAQR